MKLTLEHTDSGEHRKVMIEEVGDDLDIFEALQMVYDALVGFGYQPESVKDGLIEFARQYEEIK